MFYFNPATGESLWHHPQDDHWASLFTQCKDADGDLFERNEILTHELKVRPSTRDSAVFLVIVVGVVADDIAL